MELETGIYSNLIPIQNSLKMSKLAKAINASITGNRFPAMSLKYTDITFEGKTTPYVTEVEYCLSAKFEHRMRINDSADRSFEAMVQTFKHALIEDIFGEFRPLILDIRVATYEGDMEKVKTLVIKLENQMFTEGIK